VRDPEALNQLPREERLAWKKFWVEVADQLEQVERANAVGKQAGR
jgi:hypothetical protein